MATRLMTPFCFASMLAALLLAEGALAPADEPATFADLERHAASWPAGLQADEDAPWAAGFDLAAM